MEIIETQLLLPCYTLEDLSLDRDAREANELLAGWTALYHPALLAATGKLPRWARADSPPAELSGRLFVVPGVSHSRLPEGWLRQARNQAAIVVESYQGREDLLRQIAAAGFRLPDLPGEPVRDFFALGFGHFQVELLTRQLRYMSNLDTVGLELRAVEAAKTLVEGDPEKARQRLERAFDLLVEGREYFYPVEASLVDLVLVAPTTLGPELEQTLHQPHPINLLIEAETLQLLAERSPAVLELLRERLRAGTACVIGGENRWEELPLLPPEVLLENFDQGLAVFGKLLGTRPTVFGRRPFGLFPLLPQILRGLGFTAALHFTLDEGKFPTGSQSRIRWEGIGPGVIDAIARVPLDASADESFLRFGAKAGEVMDLDQAGAIILAHWPGKVSSWFEDLWRVSRFSNVLGQFVTVIEYLGKTYYAGQNRKYPAHEYRSPYLRQSVQRVPSESISRWVRQQQEYTKRLESETLGTILAVLGENTLADGCPPVERLKELLLAGGTKDRQGCLVLNPWSFPRQALVPWPEGHPLPSPNGLIREIGSLESGPGVIVEVPAMGFAWVGPGSPESQGQPRAKRGLFGFLGGRKTEPPMVERDTLRNEFMEVRLNRVTGSIRTVRSYSSGANALAQELALRFPTPEGPGAEGDPERFYTIMACDSFQVTSSGPLVAEVVTQGRLVARSGRTVAHYEQRYRLWQTRPWLELDIRLEPVELPQGDPWRNYYCVRFAWADATSSIYSGVGWTYQKFEGDRIESPYYVDIRSENSSFTILSGGLPFHRSIDVRKMDTLLIVKGEKARKFRIGIGVNLSHPAEAAMDFLAPPLPMFSQVAQPKLTSGWFFHVGARNVLATSWHGTYTEEKQIRLTTRLLETEGRRGTLRLRCFRNPLTAKKVTLAGEPICDLPVEGDTTRVAIEPFEWCQVEIFFAEGP
jgi:alpha-mannosidase